jgi:N-acetylmuramoyl-L-alanine amidase
MKNCKCIYHLVWLIYLIFSIISYKNMLCQVVVIDAGHGYYSDCLEGDGRTKTEINTNYEVSWLIGAMLESYDDYTIHLTRPDNDCGSWLSIDARAYITNSWNADILLSIHCNAGGGSGTETFYCESNDDDVNPDIDFAETVQYQMVSYGEWIDRRVVEDNSYLGYHLGILSQTYATACLNEIGFVDNQDDADKLLDDDWRYNFALAYAWAIEYTPTGIEDYIYLWNVTTNITQNGDCYLDRNFVDVYPYGDYIVGGYTYNIYLWHSTGQIELSTTAYPAGGYTMRLHTGTAPSGYCYLRDENNYIKGKVVVNGTDNDGSYHKSEKEIKLTDIPIVLVQRKQEFR